MKIVIEKQLKVQSEIDIDFPYYFKHDLCSDGSDCIMYGKMIDDKEETTIQESRRGNRITYEIESTRFSSCYLADEYKSSEKEFNSALFRMLYFLDVKFLIYKPKVVWDISKSIDYEKLMESLSGSVHGSPYVDFDLGEEIVLDGVFNLEDLQKIIEYKKKLMEAK